MLSKLCVRGTHKNQCEDSVYVNETESFIWGCVCDGCSTGINSHFASQLMCYLVRDLGVSCTTEQALMYYVLKLKSFMDSLNITELHLLSTMIVFKYNKQKKVLSVLPIGDGVYYINGKEYLIDQGNVPDYLTYHVNESFIDFKSRYLNIDYENVDSFQICSDGIKSFSISQFESSDIEPSILLDAPVSENYLQRMFNILTKKKWTILDDLSIISYVDTRE